jgi:hypothetical protein
MPLLIDPLLALVEENVSMAFWPAVMDDGVAVIVAVGVGFDVPPPLLDEDEPPQLASKSATAKANTVYGNRQLFAREMKFTEMMAALLPFLIACSIKLHGSASNLLGESNCAITEE